MKMKENGRYVVPFLSRSLFLLCNLSFKSRTSRIANREVSYYYFFVSYRKHVHMEKSKTRSGVRKGAWTYEEDKLLKSCIRKYGEGKWHLVPQRAGIMNVAN
jgi:hypothetical protein